MSKATFPKEKKPLNVRDERDREYMLIYKSPWLVVAANTKYLQPRTHMIYKHSRAFIQAIQVYTFKAKITLPTNLKAARFLSVKVILSITLESVQYVAPRMFILSY